MQIGGVRFFVVFHTDQRRREAGDLRLFGDHQRDRLAAEPNAVVVERPIRRTFRRHVVLVGVIGACHGWPVAVREHVNDALDGKRLVHIDARDPALGDGACNEAGMREAGCIELAGVFRRAGDFGAAIDAGCGGADIACHGLLLLTGFSCRIATAACRPPLASVHEQWPGARGRS